jgi:hypothetical protein
MVAKVGIVSAKLCTAPCMFCVQNTEHKHEIKFKSIRHRVETSWVSKVQNTTEPSSDELQWSERQPVPRGPKQDPPPPHAGCSGISANTNWTKLLLVGRARRSILQDSVKDVRNIRSEVKLRTFVNSALFRFTKGLVLRDTTH